MADIKLTDEFCEQVRGFLGRARSLQIDVLGMSLCRVRIDIAYHTDEYPHVIQSRVYEDSADIFSDGREIVEKLERLMADCEKIGIMSVAQAEIAEKKLDRIGQQIKALSRKYAETGSIETLLLTGDAEDYKSELAEIPFDSARRFLSHLPEDPGRVIEKITVAWHRDDTRAALLRTAISATAQPLP